MKITFLGTGTSQGIPIIGSQHPVCLSDDFRDKRLRVSVLVEWEQFSYVIDCGPDFRQQMLRSDCQSIDGILFTHEHADHTAGLDDIRPFFFRQGDIPIYAHQRVLDNLSKRFDYILLNDVKYPGAPSVIQNEVVENQNFELGGLSVVPINGYHNRLQVFGYRFDKFAYLTDMKTLDAEALSKLKDLDVLVINALRHEPHHSHFNIEEALDIVGKLSPKKTYFTHISHHLGFHKEVEASLPNSVFLAYDTLTIDL